MSQLLLEEIAPPTTKTKVVQVDAAKVRISSLNPRFGVEHDTRPITALALDIVEAGQINNAHGEEAADGVIELLTGSRRRVACIEAGVPIRVQVHPRSLARRRL